MYIFKNHTTKFTTLQVTSFGFSIKPSSDLFIV